MKFYKMFKEATGIQEKENRKMKKQREQTEDEK